MRSQRHLIEFYGRDSTGYTPSPPAPPAGTVSGALAATGVPGAAAFAGALATSGALAATGATDTAVVAASLALSFTPFARYDQTSIVQSDGFASRWTDLGPNGIHLDQATVGSRPAAAESSSSGFDRSLFPDASNTGVRSGVTLTASGGLVVTTNGAVISALDVTGTIRVEANNVTVRDCRIQGFAFFGIIIPEEYTGSIIEYCDIIGSSTDNCIGAGGTIQYNDLSGCENGITIFGPCLIENNYIHDLAGGVGSHFDGIQVGGGSGYTIRHNAIINQFSQTTAIMINSDFSPITGITVDDNYLEGGGYTIQVEGIASVTNNVIKAGAFGWANVTGTNVTWTGNIDADAWRYVDSGNSLGASAPGGTPIPRLIFDGVDDVLVSGGYDLSVKTALCAFAAIEVLTFGDKGVLVIGPTGLSDNDASGLLLFYPYDTDTMGTFRGGSFNLAAVGGVKLLIGVVYDITGDVVTIYNHSAGTSVISSALTNGALTNVGHLVLGSRWISGAPAAGKYAAFKIDRLMLLDFVPNSAQLNEVWTWLAEEGPQGAVGALAATEAADSAAVAATATSSAAVTWNPSDKEVGATLSGGDLTVTGTADGQEVRATQARTPGGTSYYFEVTSNTAGASLEAIGLANATFALTGFLGNNGSNSNGLYSNGYMLPSSEFAAAFAPGDVIGVELLASSAKWYKNGTLIYTVSSLPTGALFPIITVSTGGSLTGNFGATAFAHLPSGAMAWNSA